jgi:hypothetical protein
MKLFSDGNDKSESDEGLIPMCDWANEGRCFPGMVLIKCQFSGGCNKFAHHLCTIQLAVANNVDEGGIATLCKEHNHEYQRFSEQCFTLNPKRNWKTGSRNRPLSSNARHKDEEYLSWKDNDYDELNQGRSKSKEDDLKKSTIDNKSGGTFDNTENCGLNVELDKEKSLPLRLRILVGYTRTFHTACMLSRMMQCWIFSRATFFLSLYRKI